MKLILSRDSPANTQLSTEGGSLLYDISTPNKWKNVATNITKFTLSGGNSHPTGSPQELASIQYHAFSSTQIVYNGEAMNIDQFLPRKSKGFLSGYVCDI